MTTQKNNSYIPEIEEVKKARNNLSKVVINSPLQHSLILSDKYKANVYLKREDTQVVRSYKIRGAYNKITSLDQESLAKGVVCASAGNHAQGVAYSCHKLGVKGTIFMPSPTPKQKIQQVRMFGKQMVDIMLEGDTFDDAYHAAKDFERANDCTFVHPFDDEKVIEGQATIGLELFSDADFNMDYVFLPVGGGGLSAGVSSVLKVLSPKTKIIGVEPEGAPAMLESIKQNKVISLEKIDKFVDGAAVKKVGELTFPLCQKFMEEIVLVNEGKLCSVLINMYNESGIILEPAGALSVAVLDQFADKIKGKNVVCVLSGSNNDITRTEEIRERSLLYEGLMHYFIVRFPQRAGALKEFVSEVLGPDDDILHFEYTKKTSREQGPAVVGIELKSPKDFQPLLERMKERNFYGEYLNDQPDLFRYIV
ncbi:threonine ammonia-lyase [Marinoscillum sp. MHG1-6]|uniref:threonine ammonia-lyase n=1 Tax=Marinoscillum sp. MHG1-6 TaxID=2959627 RepID=UPI002157FD86|nr:threonine ammonia-lyase [Marinoscillum sp. MHG1-6]